MSVMATAADNPASLNVLNPQFTLETFRATSGNEMAVGAVNLILKACPMPSNPLYIYGKSGAGKSHLTQGLCRLFGCRGGSWFYITGEQFAAKYAVARTTHHVEAFDRKMESVQLVVVDGLSGLLKDKMAHGKLARILGALLMKPVKQVVLTDRQSPWELIRLLPTDELRIFLEKSLLSQGHSSRGISLPIG